MFIKFFDVAFLQGYNEEENVLELKIICERDPSTRGVREFT